VTSRPTPLRSNFEYCGQFIRQPSFTDISATAPPLCGKSVRKTALRLQGLTQTLRISGNDGNTGRRSVRGWARTNVIMIALFYISINARTTL